MLWSWGLIETKAVHESLSIDIETQAAVIIEQNQSDDILKQRQS